MIVMTAEEVATYLNISRSTVYRLAERGEIPVTRVGRSLRFTRESIDEWLESRRGDLEGEDVR